MHILPTSRLSVGRFAEWEILTSSCRNASIVASRFEHPRHWPQAYGPEWDENVRPMNSLGNDDRRSSSTGSVSRAGAGTRTSPSCADRARSMASRNGALECKRMSDARDPAMTSLGCRAEPCRPTRTLDQETSPSPDIRRLFKDTVVCYPLPQLSVSKNAGHDRPLGRFLRFTQAT